MYKRHYTKKFWRKYKRFKKKNSIATRKIGKAINILSSEPKKNSTHLKANLKGKRSHREGDLRVIFAICEECRKLNHVKYNSCAYCNSYSNNNLMFFDMDYRSRAYR